MVYAETIQEIQGKPTFFDRTNLAKEKIAHEFGTSVQALNLCTIEGLGPSGVRFYGPGARKTQKTKKLRKPSQEKAKNGFAPMYPEHFCVPQTMVASVSAQTPILADF